MNKVTRRQKNNDDGTRAVVISRMQSNLTCGLGRENHGASGVKRAAEQQVPSNEGEDEQSQHVAALHLLRLIWP